MALNKKDVTVLCPNGRRVNVKSTSSTSIGQIIEEACLKQKLDPLNYNLKHLKRILDPSNTIHYSNIPNHAQLELVEAAIRRQELNVVVNLATEKGERLIHEFSSSSSLWDILTYHDSIEGNCFSLPPALGNIEPFIVYTMRKLSGEELKSVTLKSLGLYGGKCMMRYSTQVKEMKNQVKEPTVVIVNKTVEASPKSTGVVDNALTTKTSSCELLEAMDCDSTDVAKGVCIEQFSPTKETETEVLELQSSTISNASQNGCSDNIISTTEVPNKEFNLESDHLSSERANNSHFVTEVQSNEMECHSTQEIDIDKENECVSSISLKADEKPVSNVISLSDHNSILFSLDDAAPLQQNEEDDAFFELTTNEVRSLHREQMKIIEELNEVPLMTNQMRELEKDKRLLMAMNLFPNTQLRICFPDRLVIQADFKPRDTVKDVLDFLRPLLIRSDLNFYLFTMFPRNVLDPESSLIDAGCIPKARIYFGTEESLPSYLSEESLSKKSSFDAASKSVIKSKVRQSKDEFSNLSENLTKVATSSELGEQKSAKIKSSEKPKWFKLGK